MNSESATTIFLSPAEAAQRRIYVAAARIGEILKVFPQATADGRVNLLNGLTSELVSLILI
jgi:hypothetical protein